MFFGKVRKTGLTTRNEKETGLKSQKLGGVWYACILPIMAYFAYIGGWNWFDLPEVLYDPPKVPY